MNFEDRIKQRLKENREAFEGAYSQQINELMGLSRTEIDQITPGTTDIEIYDHLISVVKEASRANISQAQLKQRIEQLGETAVKIAKLTSLIA